MRLRSREVSSDPETTSPTPSGNVSQEYQAADENPNQVDPGEGHDGQGTATDEEPNWQDWPDQAPPSASPSEAWDPDRSAGSAPVNLGPPPNTFYQASEPKHVNGWSYEVSTRNEIYRISTVPKDFFGVTPNWPDELRQGHRDYKATEVPMHEIIDECNKARFSQPPLPDSDLYFLQERKYNAVLRAANARADFLKTFPSAFMEAKNHKDHVRWIEVLIGYINTAQTEGLSHYQAAWPHLSLDGPQWLNTSIRSDNIIGRRIYAMSPNQYEDFRQRVADKKARLRAKIEGSDAEDWGLRAKPPPTVYNPNLPPLNPHLVIPNYTDIERSLYSLPEAMLNGLARDDRDV